MEGDRWVAGRADRDITATGCLSSPFRRLLFVMGAAADLHASPAAGPLHTARHSAFDRTWPPSDRSSIRPRARLPAWRGGPRRDLAPLGGPAASATSGTMMATWGKPRSDRAHRLLAAEQEGHDGGRIWKDDLRNPEAIGPRLCSRALFKPLRWRADGRTRRCVRRRLDAALRAAHSGVCGLAWITSFETRACECAVFIGHRGREMRRCLPFNEIRACRSTSESALRRTTLTDICIESLP